MRRDVRTDPLLAPQLKQRENIIGRQRTACQKRVLILHTCVRTLTAVQQYSSILSHEQARVSKYALVRTQSAYERQYREVGHVKGKNAVRNACTTH